MFWRNLYLAASLDSINISRTVGLTICEANLICMHDRGEEYFCPALSLFLSVFFSFFLYFPLSILLSLTHTHIQTLSLSFLTLSPIFILLFFCIFAFFFFFVFCLIVLCILFASLLFPLSPFLLTSPFLSLLFFISFLLTSLFLFFFLSLYSSCLKLKRSILTSMFPTWLRSSARKSLHKQDSKLIIFLLYI